MFNELLISRVFDEKNSVAIILYIYLYGGKTKSELYRNISSNPRMPQKITMLEDMGILRVADNCSGRVVHELTELGKKYAAALCELERVTGGNVERVRWEGMKTTIEQYAK